MLGKKQDTKRARNTTVRKSLIVLEKENAGLFVTVPLVHNEDRK